MNDSREIRLPGGRLTLVMRIGDTVHRPPQPWSGEVQRLLAHVRERGFLLVPEPLGFDAQGREVVRYIEGDTSAAVSGWPGPLWSDELLVEVGRAMSAYHRAVSDFVPSASASWQYRPRPLEPGEIICHHDFAPYNAVFRGGRLLGIVDWEGAGPGTVQEEIAFLAWQWVPLHPPEQPRRDGSDPHVDQAQRLRLLLDSYGYERREGLIDAVIYRIEISRSGIEGRADQGEAPFVALRDEGYTREMAELIAHLERNGRALQSSIE
ncbi:MAG: phosphotransferase [Acidimicrobiales bacterium]